MRTRGKGAHGRWCRQGIRREAARTGRREGKRAEKVGEVDETRREGGGGRGGGVRKQSKQLLESTLNMALLDDN